MQHFATSQNIAARSKPSLSKPSLPRFGSKTGRRTPLNKCQPLLCNHLPPAHPRLFCAAAVDNCLPGPGCSLGSPASGCMAAPWASALSQGQTPPPKPRRFGLVGDIAKYFTMFYNVLQCFTTLQNIVKHCKTLQIILQHCKTLQNVLQCFAMFCNVLQCFAMFCNIAKHRKTLQNIGTHVAMYSGFCRATCGSL